MSCRVRARRVVARRGTTGGRDRKARKSASRKGRETASRKGRESANRKGRESASRKTRKRQARGLVLDQLLDFGNELGGNLLGASRTGRRKTEGLQDCLDKRCKTERTEQGIELTGFELVAPGVRGSGWQNVRYG